MVFSTMFAVGSMIVPVTQAKKLRLRVWPAQESCSKSVSELRQEHKLLHGHLHLSEPTPGNYVHLYHHGENGIKLSREST